MENPYKKSFDGDTILCEKRHIEKGHTYEIHRHDYIEMEIILSGEAKHIYNNRAIDISRGHAYIITPRDYHALHANREVTLLNICFEPHTPDEEVREALTHIDDHSIYGILNDAQLKTAVDLFESIIQEQQKKEILSLSMAKALLCRLIILLLRSSDRQHAPEPNPPLAKAITYIHAHFREPLSLSDLSRVMSVTPNYMGKLFREHTGLSFNSYLNDIRLQCACNILRFSNHSAKDIAGMVGYASAEYFFYIFKKKMGMTPRAYRERYAGA